MARRRATTAPVPAFALYGEAGQPAPDLLHVETLQSRSRLHRWEIDAHLHQGLHQLIWLRAGPAQVTLDTERHDGRAPAVIVVPPGVVHAFRFAPESEGHVLTLSPRALVEGEAERSAAGDALRTLFEAPRVVALAEDDAIRLGHLFDALAAEVQAPGSAASPVPLWLARSVVWRLASLVRLRERVVNAAAQGHRTLFTRFVVLVEAHHAEHWPIARYANRLGLTPERLNRLVRQQAGCSALSLVHARLAREACRRLVYVAAPISQLAFELGFEDPAYFCRFVKRHTGLSPRAFRQRSSGQDRGAPEAPGRAGAPVP